MGHNKLWADRASQNSCATGEHPVNDTKRIKNAWFCGKNKIVHQIQTTHQAKWWQTLFSWLPVYGQMDGRWQIQYFSFFTSSGGEQLTVIKESWMNQGNAYSKGCKVKYLLECKTSVDLVEFNSQSLWGLNQSEFNLFQPCVFLSNDM